jgi:NAD/NADP transhydrogenase alpha subunit
MRWLLLVALAACSFVSARSPASPTTCSRDYSAPIADTVIAMPAAVVAAFAPGFPEAAMSPHSARAFAIGAGAISALAIASAVYGFAVVDPDACRPRA